MLGKEKLLTTRVPRLMQKEGTAATMFAKRIIEIPLPIPFSLILSASHITREAPAV